MGKIYDNITELIGHTPLVELHRLEASENAKARVLAKLEYFNPSGSVKDRAALKMIRAAEESGALKENGVIVEGTSGNTGIGLASIGAALGYPVKICMPDNVSEERRAILRGYGAEFYLTPGIENMKGANIKAAEVAKDLENAFVVGQGGNPNNPAAHYETTGPEIWDDTDGQVDIFVAAAGTGGTVSGAGKYLREQNPDIQIVAVEPKGSAVLNGGEPGEHKIQGIGSGVIPPTTDVELLDEVIDVTDEAAYEYAQKIAKREGISVGISSGAALKAAFELAERPENEGKTIVVILADGGERYLSSNLY